MVNVSRIKINVADLEELQQIRQIGPRRAQRILTFRDSSGQIPDNVTLAQVTGMSLKQCQAISGQLDFTLTRYQPIGYVFVLPVFFVVLILLTGVVLSQLFISEAQRPLEVIFNGSLLFIILACVSAFCAGCLQLPSFDEENHAVESMLLPLTRLVTVTLSLSGGGLMLSVIVLANWFEISNAFSQQLKLVWQYGSYLLIIFLILYGPRLHLQQYGSRLTHQGFNISILQYDFLQPLLLAAVICIQWWANSATLLEELFGLWSLVTFAIAAIELLQNKSLYIQGLSPADQRILQHNLRTRTQQKHNRPLLGTLYRRPLGLLLLAQCGLLGAALLGSNGLIFNLA